MLRQSKFLLIPILLTGIAAGQSANGYLTAGVGSGASSTIGEFAGGGEFVVAQTVGIGGELGVVTKHSSFGFFSLDGSVHLLRHAASGRFDPFVSGGYTRAFELFSGANGGNFGFGLNYWLTDRVGVRVELRDLVFSAGAPSTNYWVFRGGIAFR